MSMITQNINMASSTQSSGNAENGVKFNNFNLVPEATDHYYFKSNNSDTAQKVFSNTNASVYVKIMKEWKILEKNLPDSIHVHVYETRIDLLRAVIIGSPGTPYHDGLFFFDIALPYNYPNQPPSVYYHSHGEHLNPNLYSSGYVCLSLINTWSGRTDEMWSRNSTILQILVSIQGLVLNDRPYFNEPAYSVARNSMDGKWIRASDSYNEDVFIKSCSTMLHVIKKPPMNFEDFVAAHFRERASSILAAIECYDKGVGQFVSSSFSSKFKGSLKSIKPRLKSGFASLDKVAKKGTNLQSQQNVAKPKQKLLSRIFSFVKKLFWK